MEYSIGSCQVYAKTSSSGTQKEDKNVGSGLRYRKFRISHIIKKRTIGIWTWSENRQPYHDDLISWKTRLVACTSTCDATYIPGGLYNIIINNNEKKKI